MKTYSYISSNDFIDNLSFDFIETYSFQRGEEFETINKLERLEYESLKIRKEKLNNLTLIEDKTLYKLKGLLDFTQYIINDNGEFHPSSKKTNTFNIGNPIIDRLKEILKTEIIEIPMFMCSPKYRDAIVFYNSNLKIVLALNICLNCQYMETKMFHHINGDYKTYELLKHFFIDIGHNVEESN